MPPRPSSRRKRYFVSVASSGGRFSGGRGTTAGFFGALAAAGDGLGGRPPGLAARTLPRNESGGRFSTALRHSAHASRWLATASACASGSLPRPNALSSCTLGWITASGMALLLVAVAGYAHHVPVTQKG